MKIHLSLLLVIFITGFSLPKTQSQLSEGGNGASFRPEISGNGKYIAFLSESTDLVENFEDNNGDKMDLFVYNTLTGEIRLVSHASSGTNVGGTGDNSPAFISQNGRFITFISNSTNLIENFLDQNGAEGFDIFLYDIETQTISLVSHSIEGGTFSANGTSRDPDISSDGSFIVFKSAATNLISDFVNNNGDDFDFYLFDVANQSIKLVSHSFLGKNEGQNGEYSIGGALYLSPNNANVVFTSSATTLIEGFISKDLPTNMNLYTYDVETGTIKLISHSSNAPNVGADEEVYVSLKNVTENAVFFSTAATNLVANFATASHASNLYVANLTTGTISLVSASTKGDTISGNDLTLTERVSEDGNYIAFTSEATNLVPELIIEGEISAPYGLLYLFDSNSEEITLISHSYKHPNQATLVYVLALDISRNGNYVIFNSTASDLIPNFEAAQSSEANIYLYDIDQQIIMLISHAENAPNKSGNNDSGGEKISDDGQYIVFSSKATNLVSNFLDANSEIKPDVFLYDTKTNTLRLVSKKISG